MSGYVIHIPDTATVLEAARLAAASHLHLITDVQQVVLSPIVWPGWHRLAVKIKSPPINPQEPQLCKAA